VQSYTINNQVRQKQTKTGAGDFRIQNVRGTLDREWFLDLLNDRLGSVRADRELTADSLPQLFLEMEDAKASSRVRLCLDEWLDTGVEKTGAEDPRERDLTRAPNAQKAIRRFSRTRPVELTIEPDGLSVNFVPSQPVSARDLMQRVGRPEQTAQDRSDRFVALFLLSPWRWKLAKCRRVQCGHYFELRQWNRSYERGTFCPKCTRIRSLESALESTKRKREQDHNDKISRAAEAITEWERGSHKGRTRPTWKQYVCKRHPDITAKSLTRWTNCGELKPPQRNEHAES